eukprot:INCI15562.1.p1 GENE.INCI15562.1~~INCI15562.1.p1  ORF type:complete len:358 (+),score=38.60 INCI15562.1:535-1608(+)
MQKEWRGSRQHAPQCPYSRAIFCQAKSSCDLECCQTLHIMPAFLFFRFSGVTSLPPNGRNIAVEFKVVARVQTSPSKSLPQQPAQGATTSAAQATPISGTLPLGDPVPGWCTRPPISIPKAGLRGRTVMLSPLDAEAHSNDLWEACSQDPHPDGRPGGFAMWTYLPCGPWNCRADFDVDIQQKAASSQFHFVAVLVPAKCSELHEQSDQKQHLLPPGTRWRAVGFASIMRVCPEMGTAEIGWVSFAPPLQRTTASTEALYLLMRHVMTLGYRRLEWKCDSLNAPSARAAQRLGFQYEGTFRQAVVYKGRNRNTSWFSILDIDWPVVDQAISSWLSTNNFDSSGQQKKGLNDFFKSKH